MTEQQGEPIGWSLSRRLSAKKDFLLEEIRILLSIILNAALAGVAQWIEYPPANQRVTGSIPSLGHVPGL